MSTTREELNNQNPYDVLATQIDEQAFDRMPWNMNSWHPSGAQFDHCSLPLSVVVTDWCDDFVYDVCLYTEHEVGPDGDLEPIQAFRTDIGVAGAFVTMILNEAERIATEAGALAPDPLPLPVPGPTELAAKYIADVRRNGPEFMQNVAEVDTGRGAYHRMGVDISEIAMEIDEAFPTLEIPYDHLHSAAQLAITTFADELGIAR